MSVIYCFMHLSTLGVRIVWSTDRLVAANTANTNVADSEPNQDQTTAIRYLASDAT